LESKIISSNGNWKKNLAPPVRTRIWIRDTFSNRLYHPYQRHRYRTGKADKDLFKHILIQTNYLCTRRCSFCHFGLEPPPVNQELDKSLFYEIISQLKAISYNGRVGLFEINEPLTDNRFDTFLRHTRENLPKAWIFISTNGDILQTAHAERLFEMGLNFVYLSSYDEAALKRNTKLLKEIKPKFRNRINHLNRTYQNIWDSRGGNVKQFKSEPVFNCCDMVHRVLYIKPSGKVHACYNDFYDKCVVGNLHEEKLLDIWYGDQFCKLRKNLDAGKRDLSTLCKRV
jgi:Radical SAM superfamily.